MFEINTQTELNSLLKTQTASKANVRTRAKSQPQKQTRTHICIYTHIDTHINKNDIVYICRSVANDVHKQLDEHSRACKRIQTNMIVLLPDIYMCWEYVSVFRKRISTSDSL